MINSFTSKFKTLENIQASFVQAVNDLKNLRARNTAVIEKNEDTILQIEARNNSLATENTKAAKFQENLERLLA